MRLLTLLSSALGADFVRYRRSSALLLVALATPIAAHFMVPITESSYSVLLVNGDAPVLTPAVLGLELGMITATVLTPLAYIFLRAGPTSRRPWQVTDLLPYSRPVVALGRWAADTATLWVLLGALTVAGAVLMFLRAGATFSSVLTDFASMSACLWLTAGPALALTASARALFATLRATRGWGGDVAFFFLWIFGLSLPVILLAGAGGAITDPPPMLDPFGMIYPVVNAVDVPVTELAIGGGPPSQTTIAVDALRGSLTLPFASSRVAWIAMAALLSMVAGVLYQPHRATGAAPTLRGGSEASAPALSEAAAPAASPAALRLPGLLGNQLSLLLRPRRLAWLIGAVAAAGVALPYREMVGPALMLLAIFPMTAAAARWERGDLPGFLNTAAATATERRGAVFGAALIVGLLAHLPAAIVALGSDQEHLLTQALSISIGVPALSLLGAWLTKGAVAARLLLLIVWYGYFASAGS